MTRMWTLGPSATGTVPHVTKAFQGNGTVKAWCGVLMTPKTVAKVGPSTCANCAKSVRNN